MAELKTIIVDGVTRRLGTLKPRKGELATCSIPVFEDHVEPLDMKTIERLARSLNATGRTIFGDQYIMDQGAFGSCNGYATAGALMRSQVRCGLPFKKRSGDYAYAQMNDGRDQGSTLARGMRVVVDIGIATAATVPQGAIYPHLYDRQKADREAANSKAFEVYGTDDIQAFWTGLCLGWDGVCAVHASRNFQKLDSNGVAGVDRGPGNHAVMCDGIVYAGGEVCGDGVNSWGLRYGERGRMKLRRAHFEQTIGVHQFWLLRAVSMGDADGPPKVVR